MPEKPRPLQPSSGSPLMLGECKSSRLQRKGDTDTPSTILSPFPPVFSLKPSHLRSGTVIGNYVQVLSMLWSFALLLTGCPQAPGSTKLVTKPVVTSDTGEVSSLSHVLQLSPKDVLVPGPNHAWLFIPPLHQSHCIFLYSLMYSLMLSLVPASMPASSHIFSIHTVLLLY